MNYLKVTFRITPAEEWFSDLLINDLADLGFDSFVEIPDGFEAYIPFIKYQRSAVEDIALLDDNRFTVSISEEETKDRNWNEEWEKNYFKPLLVAGRCLIRAPFHTEFPEAEIEIVIEPKMAFGTGNHETTSLMMEFILSTSVSGKSVLDMGSGTAILSILASKLGASSVTAIDTDEWAYHAGIENAAINGTDNIIVRQGDASLLESGNYDIILANIQRNIILNDLPAYNSVLKNNGIIFLSGFYTRDLELITDKANSLGLRFIRSAEKNNWVAAIFLKE
jgi:ribosomal protein L11 methyltransferase